MKHKKPAFLFYPADYLSDTKSLSLEEHGAWILILCEFYRAQPGIEITIKGE